MLTVLNTLSLLLSLIGLVRSYGGQPLLRRNIIKVRASGFMPFESDLLLPLGILRQLQSQDRASRFHRPEVRPPVKPRVKQQIRLERAHPLREAKGVQLYNLIDDDGELLLNLKVHQEQKGSGSYQETAPLGLSTKEKLYQSKFQDYDSPWLPSKWRPTSEFPLGVTSSSPRPLPLHQYLGQSNQIAERKTAKRRRVDMWPHK